MATLMTSPTVKTVKTPALSVLTVHNRYMQPGGEDQVFESEARLLTENGCKVQIFCEQTTNPNGILQKISTAVDCVWSRDSYRQFQSLLRESRPDVVHIHNFFPVISPSVYYACRDANVPVVQTLHNYRLICPAASFYRDGKVCEECLDSGPFHAVRYGCYRGSKLGTAALATMLEVHRRKGTWSEVVDCYISLTEFARKKMIEGGLPAEKIRVKPNFVLPDPGRRTNSGDYALFVGRLEELKGVPTMLSAWEQLPKSIPLVIAGDGAYRVGMEAEITKRQLSHVNYKGRLSREKTLEAMKNARFLIFPSEWYEGFPVTIAESFACGVPVICSRMGSMQEIVDDHRCGLHFTPGDASDLAAKVQWAWSHPEDVDMMGHQARVDFETRYSAARNYEMLSEIYGSVMAGRESRGPKVGAS